MTVLAPTPALYIDDLRYDSPVDDLLLINTIPEEDETDVSASGPFSLTIASMTGDAVSAVVVEIARSSLAGGTQVVYTQAGGYAVGFTGTAILRASPGSGVFDELVLTFVPDTPFESLEIITAYVHAAAGALVEDWVYAFTIEDLTAPALDAVLWLHPRKAIVSFDEPVSRLTTPGGGLFAMSTKGNVAVVSTTEIELRSPTLSSAWVGFWVCLNGSVYPANNQYRPILSVDTSTGRIVVDTSATYGGPLVVDDGRDTDSSGILVRERQIGLSISPWMLEARLSEEGAGTSERSEERIQVAALPRVKRASAVDPADVPAGFDANAFLYLEFEEDISINRLYTLHCTGVDDLFGNTASDSQLDFQAPSFGAPDGRIQFWQRGNLSPLDMQRDLEGEGNLRKICVVMQDTTNILYNRADQLDYLDDPYHCPDEALDHALYDMGNPFRFSLPDEQTKRKLIFALQNLYKHVGLSEGIVNFIKDFLGITVEVIAFATEGYWVIGSATLGQLGVTTRLAPSSDYVENSYQIVSPVDLTAWERRVISESAQWIDPINMHLISIIEPSTAPAGVSPTTYWKLGVSALGSSTTLGP